MIYDNSSIRRQDRLLDEEQAMRLLEKGEYGVLSIAAETGGYGIPINYVWDGETSIYFHCAPEGRKLSLLSEQPKVSFCVVGRTEVISRQFTTAYESIIIEGSAHLNLPEEERRRALRLLIDKYSPNDTEIGLKYIEKSFPRTAIIKIVVEKISGKCKRVNSKG